MSKKILLIGYFPRIVGARQVSEDFADQLSANGWHVICTSAQRQRIPRLLDILQTTWKQREHYDVAHISVYSGLSFIWSETTAELLQRLGKPYVLTLHGGNLPAFARRWSGRVHRLFRKASAITTPSPYLQEHMKLYRSDIQLIPNAIELQAYQFQERVAPQPKLIWLRAFQKYYRPELAVYTLALLRETFPTVQLRMIGLDKGDQSLQRTIQLVDELNLQDCFTYVGAIGKADVPENLNTADILLNTPDIDNTPVSVLEAMACGLCVVSTDVGGLPYLLTHEKDALLVPSNNPMAMKAAVARILCDSNLAATLSQNARQKVEAFSWELVLQQWESLLTRTIEQPHEQ